MNQYNVCFWFALEMEEYPAETRRDEADESTTSHSITMDQEASHSQSDTPDQLEHEVIVIVTDTESENEQEEGDEEEEEQVGNVDCIQINKIAPR